MTSLHYNRVLTLVTLSLNGTAQPAVNVSEGGKAAPKITKPDVTTSALEHYASANPFMVLCEGDSASEESNGGQLSSHAVVLATTTNKNRPEVKIATPTKATVATKGTTHSFPWPAIWIAIFFAVAVLFSCIGLPGMGLGMNIGFGGAAPLDESSSRMATMCDEFVALQQCPPWAGSDEVSPNATEVEADV